MSLPPGASYRDPHFYPPDDEPEEIDELCELCEKRPASCKVDSTIKIPGPMFGAPLEVIVCGPCARKLQ